MYVYINCNNDLMKIEFENGWTEKKIIHVTVSNNLNLY